MIKIQPDDALIVVDPQNDFLPGGALAVATGNRIFPPINALLPRFAHVYATRDWHPADHSSFAAQGGPWPVHCVQNSSGAEFSPLLHASEIDAVISTGVDRADEGYSGFAGTDLAERLRHVGVHRIFVCGLATDYCVRATALDGRRNGFDVVLITDAIAAVNVKSGDDAAALEEMRRAGVELVESAQIAYSPSLT